MPSVPHLRGSPSTLGGVDRTTLSGWRASRSPAGTVCRQPPACGAPVMGRAKHLSPMANDYRCSFSVGAKTANVPFRPRGGGGSCQKCMPKDVFRAIFARFVFPFFFPGDCKFLWHATGNCEVRLFGYFILTVIANRKIRFILHVVPRFLRKGGPGWRKMGHRWGYTTLLHWATSGSLPLFCHFLKLFFLAVFAIFG